VLCDELPVLQAQKIDGLSFDRIALIEDQVGIGKRHVALALLVAPVSLNVDEECSAT
jgi:hypothetical protein